MNILVRWIFGTISATFILLSGCDSDSPTEHTSANASYGLSNQDDELVKRYCAAGSRLTSDGTCWADTCPEGTIRHTGGYCVAPCEEGFTHDTDGRCMVICPDGYGLTSSDGCLPANSNYLDSIAKTCPPGFMAIAPDHCESFCPSGWDETTNNCKTPDCPSGTTLQENGSCIAIGATPLTCPADATLTAENSCLCNQGFKMKQENAETQAYCIATSENKNNDKKVSGLPKKIEVPLASTITLTNEALKKSIFRIKNHHTGSNRKWHKTCLDIDDESNGVMKPCGDKSPNSFWFMQMLVNKSHGTRLFYNKAKDSMQCLSILGQSNHVGLVDCDPNKLVSQWKEFKKSHDKRHRWKNMGRKNSCLGIYHNKKKDLYMLNVVPCTGKHKQLHDWSFISD